MDRAPTTGYRVLIADDEASFTEPTSALLLRAGYSCETARSADAALASLARERVDVLIADVLMDGNESLELLATCHERFPNLPIVVVTGAPTTPKAVSAFRLGVVDFLAKPVERGDVLRAVHKAVERGELLRVAQRLRDGLNECISGLDALRSVMDAPRAVQPVTSEPVLREFRDETYQLLSARELDVLRALVAGQRPDVIAKKLFISTHTVRNHLKSIYRKLDVHSHVELLARVRAS